MDSCRKNPLQDKSNLRRQTFNNARLTSSKAVTASAMINTGNVQLPQRPTQTSEWRHEAVTHHDTDNGAQVPFYNLDDSQSSNDLVIEDQGFEDGNRSQGMSSDDSDGFLDIYSGAKELELESSEDEGGDAREVSAEREVTGMSDRMGSVGAPIMLRGSRTGNGAVASRRAKKSGYTPLGRRPRAKTVVTECLNNDDARGEIDSSECETEDPTAAYFLRKPKSPKSM